MEADVNVLVVGGSTARGGAIGRHFPCPLIRRCSKPVLRRRLLSLLPAQVRQSRQTKDLLRLASKVGVGRRACVWGRRGGQPPRSLY